MVRGGQKKTKNVSRPQEFASKAKMSSQRDTKGAWKRKERERERGREREKERVEKGNVAKLQKRTQDGFFSLLR
jgi:hypothetical protein